MGVFRIKPNLPAEFYATYAISRPRSTHTRTAYCPEVECPNYLNGWATLVDLNTELGRAQVQQIRSGHRRFKSYENQMYVAADNSWRQAPGMVTFIFEPGQFCFSQHVVDLDRPPVFAVRGGDWRGNPRHDLSRRFRNFDDWANHFAEHQDRLAKAQR